MMADLAAGRPTSIDLSLDLSPILSAFGGSGRQLSGAERRCGGSIQRHRRACESLLGGTRDCALASAVAHDQHHGVSVMYFNALRLWKGSAKQCRCRCATELCGGTWKQKTRSGRGVHCPRRSRSSPEHIITRRSHCVPSRYQQSLRVCACG